MRARAWLRISRFPCAAPLSTRHVGVLADAAQLMSRAETTDVIQRCPQPLLPCMSPVELAHPDTPTLPSHCNFKRASWHSWRFCCSTPFPIRWRLEVGGRSVGMLGVSGLGWRFGWLADHACYRSTRHIFIFRGRHVVVRGQECIFKNDICGQAQIHFADINAHEQFGHNAK